MVIWNKENYIAEGMRQLNDGASNKLLKKNPNKTHKHYIDKLLDNMLQRNEIHESTYLYLKSGGNRTSVFYMLPKIHKDLINPPGNTSGSGGGPGPPPDPQIWRPQLYNLEAQCTI